MRIETKKRIEKIKPLIEQGFNNAEIARKLEVPKGKVSNIVQRYLEGNRNYFKPKYCHEMIFKYYMDHSFSECQEKFNLTVGELKSVFTSGYLKKELKKYRKDTRRKDKWSVDDLLLMLRYSGLRDRKWIGKKLKRGSYLVVKEKLSKMGLSTRKLSGLRYSEFIKYFNRDPILMIKTKSNNQIVIPWYHVHELIKFHNYKTYVDEHKIIFECLAMIQIWLLGNDPWIFLMKIMEDEI